jgi:hypothetical protein
MAKRKSKKTSAKMPHSTMKLGISKSQFDNGCAIAQKTISFMGFDPALFSMFSKKQKHELLDIEIHMPLIRIKNGNCVPRQYVAKIRASTMEFMRTYYVDEKVRLTYMEFVTYGLPFLLICGLKYTRKMFTAEQEEAFVEKMVNKIKLSNLATSGWFDNLFVHLWFELSLYSQANFRTYGFEFTIDVPKPKEIIGTSATARCVIELTSYENESIYFVYKDIKRKAFGLLLGNMFIDVPLPAVIKHQKLYPESKSSKEYKIYIQSHAIHRLKERIDIGDVSVRNHLISLSLTRTQKVMRSATGQPLISCYINGISLGYFPYTIQGDKLFVLSFLPFVNQITPEGEKLHKILNLGKDELIYLGMDKLSFYITVDFDEIPILKNAFMESGIWQIIKELYEGIGDESGIDKVKTQFVKNFLQKTEMRRIQSLSENETQTETFEE